jgi:zinc protease
MLDRTIAPPFQKTLALSLPDPADIGGGSGFSVFHLSGLPQNVVKLEVIFNSGKSVESKIGLSHFTSVMLEKGTVGRTSAQIAATLDRYGASLEINPGFDFVSVSLFSLKEKLRDIFPVYLEIMTYPSFPEKEWQLMLDIFKQNLKVNNEKTSFVASKFIRRNIFGKDHPYGSTVEEHDAEAIQAADLHLFFKEAFTVQSAWVLGDLKMADLVFIRDGFQVLAKGPVARNTLVKNDAKPFPWQTHKEGRTQSSIRLGKRCILKTDPDYPDVLLATHVLGGFFGSRLMKNIREEKGLTYGIYSSLNTFMNDSLFIIGADVNQENVPLALAEIKNEIKNLILVPMDMEELSLARNHFIGSLQTDMANIFSVEEKLKNVYLNNLGHGFYQDLLIRVDQITPQEIMTTARKYFDVDTLFEVVVG